MSANLMVDPEKLNETLPVMKKLLGGFSSSRGSATRNSCHGRQLREVRPVGAGRWRRRGPGGEDRTFRQARPHAWQAVEGDDPWARRASGWGSRSSCSAGKERPPPPDGPPPHVTAEQPFRSTDLAELYPVLIVIYPFECACSSPGARWGCCRGWGAGACARRSRRARTGGAGSCSASRGRPGAGAGDRAAAAGCWARRPLRGRGRRRRPRDPLAPWDEVQRVAADGTRLRVNGEPVAVLATRVGARALAQAFDGLAALSRPEGRAGLDAGWTPASMSLRRARPAADAARDARAAHRGHGVWVRLFAGCRRCCGRRSRRCSSRWPSSRWWPWIIAAVLFERALRRSRGSTAACAPIWPSVSPPSLRPWRTLRACRPSRARAGGRFRSAGGRARDAAPARLRPRAGAAVRPQAPARGRSTRGRRGGPRRADRKPSRASSTRCATGRSIPTPC